MKSPAQTKRTSTKPAAKPATKPAARSTAKRTREATPVRRAEKPAPQPVQAEAPPPVPPKATDGIPMPELTAFSIDEGDARAHVLHCEQCGRAHRHVVKNPKDAMALHSFARGLAGCLAGDQVEAPA